MSARGKMKYSILKISSLIFIEICKHGMDKVKVVDNALPEDAKFVRAFVDDNLGWGRISLVLESESFKDLNEGDEIPILPNPAFEKVYESK
jgi:hypothetical protein